MTREEAEKELIAMLEEAEGGPTYSMEEVDAYMRELLHPKNQIYLTGDTHGRFERIISFCERQQVQPESTFIILGDVGLNYYGDRRDRRGKDALAQIPITFFCIHGNHEMRPSEELGYQVKETTVGRYGFSPSIQTSYLPLTERSMISLAIPVLSLEVRIASINTTDWQEAITGLKTSSRPMKSRRKLSVCYLSVIGRSMLCCRTPARSGTSRPKYFYP